jgi:hypothetical protein
MMAIGSATSAIADLRADLYIGELIGVLKSVHDGIFGGRQDRKGIVAR